MDPACDKTFIRGGAAQCVFPQRQRAPDAGGGLGADDQNGRKVRDPITEIAHPAPAGRSTDPDQRQAEYDKQHKHKMDDKDEIGEQQLQALRSGVTARNGAPAVADPFAP